MAPKGTGFPNTTYAASDNGWMEKTLFENFFEHTFLRLIEPVNLKPTLLIYDEHKSHISLPLIERLVKEM